MAQSLRIRLAEYILGQAARKAIAPMRAADARVRAGADTLVPHATLIPGSAALLLIMLGYHSVHASAQCMLPVERTAFDVRALQSQMMIAGLTCGRYDEYNIFVQRHQPALVEADRQIGLHFKRLYGAAGEEQHDAYITELANVHSQEGMHGGADNCPALKSLVLRALTLRDVDEMSRFATENSVTNPYALATCEQAPETEEVPDRVTQNKVKNLIRNLNPQNPGR